MRIIYNAARRLFFLVGLAPVPTMFLIMVLHHWRSHVRGRV